MRATQFTNESPLRRRVGSAPLRALALALLFALAGVTPAQAGPPNHLPLADPINGFPLDHACGAATDSEGDIYLASAGNDAIEVFGPDGNHLATIANSNQPCALAVDSSGRLYVSERGTGNVVRYDPDAYPLTGAPVYAAPAAIDSGGQARGVSVDPADDRLFVAKGDHVAVYRPDGTPDTIDEIQRVFVFSATSGTFTLSFRGQTTAPIPFDVTHAQLQAALESLSTIGPGNVSVSEGPNHQPIDHLVRFTGALGGTDVERMVADDSGLGAGSILIFNDSAGGVQGFSGRIGDGALTDATGVAAYTYAPTRYVSVADDDGDEVKVFSGDQLRTAALKRTIDQTPDGELGFGAAGALLTADQGTCPPTDQACTGGHFFVYDDAHAAVHEFEATGRHLAKIDHPDLADAQPTAIAVDRSGGASNGTVYVTAGAGAGAKLLAFAPLPTPARRPLPERSFPLERVCAVRVDGHGNRYLAAGGLIKIYDPSGNPIGVGSDGQGIFVGASTCEIEVDSAGNVYALLGAGTTTTEVVVFEPNSFPPADGATYQGPRTIATNSTFPVDQAIKSIGLNPANDHIFVSQQDHTIEFDSLANGSAVLNPNFAAGLNVGRFDLAVYGANGNVYMAGNGGALGSGFAVRVVDPTGTEVLARITGAGSPEGAFSSQSDIAVDQSSGHLLYFEPSRGVAEEYEPSGTFVAEFGNVTRGPGGITIDNTGGPNDGTVYATYVGPLDGVIGDGVFAFGSLNYGEPPIAKTGIASAIDAGNATLNGTVDPREFAVTDCRFEYVADAQFQTDGFASATSVPCAQTPAEIGSGGAPVPVHVDLSGLEPGGRYRFRLLAANKFGTGEGEAGLFGPPLISAEPPRPILYSEATVRGAVDPSGLPTTYRVEYGASAAYGQSTPDAELAPGSGPVDVEVFLSDLDEGTTYHFRLVADNEAGTAAGPDQTLTTLARPAAQDCSNAELRLGRSSHLPDCRAYELVTPADTRSYSVGVDAPAETASMFSHWIVTPRGPSAGNIVYFSGPLAGFEDANGFSDGYEAVRDPEAGWSSRLFSPGTSVTGESPPGYFGVSADHRFSFWSIRDDEFLRNGPTIPEGRQLGTPEGFELLGQGSLGTDPDAFPRFLTSGGSHVVFTSAAQLEPGAAPAGTEAVYDRDRSSPGGPTRVVSLRPDGGSFAAGEDATFRGASEDGSSIVFEVGGTLYVRQDNAQTLKIADAPVTFNGVSADGGLVFYATFVGLPTAAGLFAFDLDSQTATQIAADSRFFHVSRDGSHVYLASEQALGGEGTPGEPNLFVWDLATGATDFVAVLDRQDLDDWHRCVDPHQFGGTASGVGNCDSRTTPDGSVLVFESEANLTAYDGEGHAEIYRYDSVDGSVICVSCDPTGAAPTAGAALLTDGIGIGGRTTILPNVTEDGARVLFNSADALLPGDANTVNDVYEWQAEGVGGCQRSGGCLALISSGQADTDSHLYAMTPDGRDVFFITLEQLVGADIPSTRSLYDARAGGGFAEAQQDAPCQGDACQGDPSPAPVAPSPGSAAFGGPGNPAQSRDCSAARRRVRRAKRRLRRARTPKHKRAARRKLRRARRRLQLCKGGVR